MAADEPLFVGVNDDDPAMLSAVAVAKRTWPQFVDAFTRNRFTFAAYLVKVPFWDRSGTAESARVRTSDVAAEHPTEPMCRLWLAVNSISEGLLFCSVLEAPPALRLATRDSFIIESSLIEDWMINQDGIVYGGFSIRALRDRLSEHARGRFDDYTGIREFKQLVL